MPSDFCGDAKGSSHACGYQLKNGAIIAISRDEPSRTSALQRNPSGRPYRAWEKAYLCVAYGLEDWDRFLLSMPVARFARGVVTLRFLCWKPPFLNVDKMPIAIRL